LFFELFKSESLFSNRGAEHTGTGSNNVEIVTVIMMVGSKDWCMWKLVCGKVKAVYQELLFSLFLNPFQCRLYRVGAALRGRV
jgi:hypothetical protein